MKTLSKNQVIFVIAVLAGLALAQYGKAVKAADPCKSSPTILLDIPGWDDPVKLTPADRVRCAYDALAELPRAELPLPYAYGGPLPPSTLHLWNTVPQVAPWPEEVSQ